MKNKFALLWLIWTLLGALLLYGVAVSDSNNSINNTIAMVLSLSPILGFMLALGSVDASRQVNNWFKNHKNSLYYVAGGLSVLFAIPGILTNSFNPYHTIIFSFIVFVVLGLLNQAKENEFKLNWSDLAIWIILWIPFDLRWYTDLQPNIDYTWWSIAISVIALIGWCGYRGADLGFRLVPKLKDITIALIALVLIMVLVIPPGLVTGFLSFSIPNSFDIPKIAAHFIGLFLTVALPEELFFRGILLRGLDKTFKKAWIPLVISSLAFGLMHWNNIGPLTMQITYVCLATIAGLGYGWAYRKSGNNLLAAILAHTLVDWVWKLVLAT